MTWETHNLTSLPKDGVSQIFIINFKISSHLAVFESENLGSRGRHFSSKLPNLTDCKNLISTDIEFAQSNL